MTTPEDARDFTEREFQFIFGVCLGLSNKEIAQHLGCSIEGVVSDAMNRIFDKADVCNRLELMLFVKTTLNAELRRRSGRGESAS